MSDPPLQPSSRERRSSLRPTSPHRHHADGPFSKPRLNAMFDISYLSSWISPKDDAAPSDPKYLIQRVDPLPLDDNDPSLKAVLTSDDHDHDLDDPDLDESFDSFVVGSHRHL